MSDHDITALLEREAESLPPPPTADVHAVLRAGDRRRRRRQGGYALATAAVFVAVAGVGMSLRPSNAPVASPQISQPFGPALAAVPVCAEQGSCQPVAPELVEQTVDVIEASGIAEIVEVQDAEDVAADFPSADDSPPPDQFIQSVATRVIFRVKETTDPQPLFRDLVALPFVDSVQLGTATIAPHLWPEEAEPGHEQAPQVEYRTLEVPVDGREHPVTYSTFRDELGRLCVESPSGTGCSWTTFQQGLMVGAGPWSDRGRQLRCVEGMAGYNIAEVVIQLEDGRTVPTHTVPARTDLAHPMLVAGCWVGPNEDITVIGYDANGNEVHRQEFTEPAPPSSM